jgi:hypothetical protein
MALVCGLTSVRGDREKITKNELLVHQKQKKKKKRKSKARSCSWAFLKGTRSSMYPPSPTATSLIEKRFFFRGSPSSSCTYVPYVFISQEKTLIHIYLLLKSSKSFMYYMNLHIKGKYLMCVFTPQAQIL